MDKTRVVVIGKESVGKSQLIAGLSGAHAISANFCGTTVAASTYETPSFRFVDTPGIVRSSDMSAVSTHLDSLHDGVVMVVAQATHLDSDLADLLPLVTRRRIVVAVTFWDKVAGTEAADRMIRKLAEGLGVPVFTVDARRIDEHIRESILDTIEGASVARTVRPPVRAGWQIEPRETVLEQRYLGTIAAILLLFAPAVAAVLLANALAGAVEPVVESVTERVADRVTQTPAPVAEILAGDYGIVSMGPLLLVWAVPVVVVFALLLGAYKASGLIDRISTALHPLMRRFGLGGRDVTRVLMGFGCNVPAIVSTRTCSSCTRPNAVAAIAFGSACSYQLGATLSVFAAAGKPMLVLPYLGVLVVTTLIYLRLTASRESRDPLNLDLVERRTFLVWPSMQAIWMEASTTIVSFLRTALPIFFLITIAASLIAWAGALDLFAAAIAPGMALFGLPAESALPTVMAAVRKDGILLFGSEAVMTELTTLQLLVAVYLAGVLLPCLVTAFTMARELGVRFVALTVGKQMGYTMAVSMSLAWGGFLAGF